MRFSILFTLLICAAFTITKAQTNSHRRVTNRNAYLSNKIATGRFHALEIRNGTLWAWGSNGSGQVGDGTNILRASPVQVGTDDDWVCVKAGGNHTLAIKADGTLWAWGSNSSGQVGDNTLTHRNTPVQIGADNDWAGIAAGFTFSMAIKTDGTIWAWGENSYGQLGIGPNGNSRYPVQVGNGNKWVHIAAGYYHSFGIQADGTLWTWGNNGYGRLGVNNTTISNIYSPYQIGTAHDWLTVEAGIYHTLAIKANGTLWALGRNHFDQLGDNSMTNRYAPIQVGTDRNWVAVAAGDTHSLCIKADGSRWGFGLSYRGSLGNGNTDTLHVPARVDMLNNWLQVSTNNVYGIGLKADGSTSSWGWNPNGQLGDGTTNTTRLTPVLINTNDEWASISAGGNFSGAVRNDGSLWTWGRNNSGQLGDGTSINKNIHSRANTSDNWTHISSDIVHSIAIKADGTLWSWGQNQSGQLGDGTTTMRSSPIQIGSASNWVSVATGYAHSFALKADGRLWGWGSNSLGQLGNGTSNSTNIPILIDTNSTWVHIATGDYHTLGIKADGTLWAWGYNSYGQLGVVTTTARSSPTKIGTANDWVSVSAGSQFSVAIKADGTVWVWGLNAIGQLGIGSTANSIGTPTQAGTGNNWIKIDAGPGGSHAIRADGTLWACGLNLSGQLGDGTNTNKISLVQIGTANKWVDIAGGDYHTLGIKAPRSRICATGYNYFGALGDGTNTNRNTFDCICIQANIYAMPANQAICDVANTYFTIKAKDAIAYQWQVNNGNGWSSITNNSVYQGATTDSLALINVDISYHNYWYRCIAINDCNDTTYSDSAVLEVGNTITINTQPIDVTICDSTNTEFYVEATGGNITYQWLVNDGGGWNNIGNGGIYSGANTDTLKLSGATTTVNGYRYRCEMTNVCTVTSDTAMITILPLTATSVSISLNDTVCTGDNASFTATPVNGGNSPTYQWQVNGNNAGGNSAGFTLTAPASGDVVKCFMTSNETCPSPKISESNEIQTVVHPYVTPAVTISSDVGNDWCAGRANVFRSAATNGGPKPGYQWKINGNNLGPDADTLWVPFLNNGDVVECIMTSNAPCPQPETAGSNKIQMTIQPSTQLNIVIVPNPDSIVCKDKEVTMYAAFNTSGLPPYFQWMLNGVDIQGETNGTLKTTALQDGDVINCRLSSNGVCVFPDVSNPVAFEVKPILQPQVSVSVLYLGNNQHLFTAIPADEGANPVYQWYLNGKKVKNQSGSTITLSDLKSYDKVYVELASSEQCIPVASRLVSSNIITTGIEDDHALKALNLYPNPNKGTFTIEGNLNITGADEVHMTILNSIGQVVYKEVMQVEAGVLNHTVNTHSRLVPGGYLLKLDYDGQQDFRRFVMVR